MDSSSNSIDSLNSSSHSHSGKVHQETQIKWAHINYWKFGAFNIVCHAFLDALTYPSELLRTRMQLQSKVIRGMEAYFPVYNNTLHGFQTIYRHEGIRGLYRGFIFSEFGWSISTFFNYITYEFCKEEVQKIFPATSKTDVFITTFLAGGLASSLGLFLSVPTEIIQQRLQVQGSGLKELMYTGAYDVTRRIHQTYGVMGFYRGGTATAVRDSLASATWWSVYEISKYFFHDHDPRDLLRLRPRKAPEFYRKSGLENEDPVIQMFAGVCAATAMCVVSNPVDVVKTRLQTQDLINNVTSSHYRSTIPMFVSLFKKEGISLFFKGLTPGLMVTIPSSLVGVLIYEYSKKLCLKVPE